MAMENFSWLLLDTLNQPITTANPTPTILIRRVSDNFIYDWSDSAFKSSGWTTKSQDMAEVDASNFAGVYDAALDVGAFTGYYYAYLVYNSPGDTQRIAKEFNVIDGAISNLVHGLTNAESTALNSAPTNVWDYTQ